MILNSPHSYLSGSLNNYNYCSGCRSPYHNKANRYCIRNREKLLGGKPDDLNIWLLDSIKFFSYTCITLIATTTTTIQIGMAEAASKISKRTLLILAVVCAGGSKSQLWLEGGIQAYFSKDLREQPPRPIGPVATKVRGEVLRVRYVVGLICPPYPK